MRLFENEYYKGVKENLSIILLVPTLLGGLWQIIELSRISTSFIRFFSVSQIIPDGILILFFLSFLYAGLMIAYSHFKSYTLQELFKGFNKDENVKGVIIINSAMFSVSLLSFYLLYPGFESFWNERTLAPAVVFVTVPAFLIVVFGLFFSSITLLKVLASRIGFKIGIKVIQFGMAVLMLLLLYVGIGLCFVFASAFHKNFSFPHNFKNIEYLDCKISHGKFGKYKHQVLYFNDKYAFVKYEVDKKEIIEVFDFKDLLTSVPCE